MEHVSGVIKKETKEISELVEPELVGQTVKVNGAVHVIRDMGEIALYGVVSLFLFKMSPGMRPRKG